jgi:hypothetical protein
LVTHKISVKIQPASAKGYCFIAVCFTLQAVCRKIESYVLKLTANSFQLFGSYQLKAILLRLSHNFLFSALMPSVVFAGDKSVATGARKIIQPA